MPQVHEDKELGEWGFVQRHTPSQLQQGRTEAQHAPDHIVHTYRREFLQSHLPVLHR